MAELPSSEEIKAGVISPANQARARREVERRAEHADDARVLLAMLGLDNTPPRKARRGNRGWPSDLGARPAAPDASASRSRCGPVRMDKAACAGDDPELWHPLSEADPATHARDTCARCPVLEKCGTFAAKQRIEFGIWAGHRLDVVEERRALHRAYGTPRATETPAELELVCAECDVTFTTKQQRVRCRPCELGMPFDTEAREHIAQLRAGGATWRDIAVAAELAEQTVREIAKGAVPRIRLATHERILAVTGIGSAVPACLP